MGTVEHQLILNLSIEHALSTAYGNSKNLRFIGVIYKIRLLLFCDSLLIRCACVLIRYNSVQAHRP